MKKSSQKERERERRREREKEREREGEREGEREISTEGMKQARRHRCREARRAFWYSRARQDYRFTPPSRGLWIPEAAFSHLPRSPLPGAATPEPYADKTPNPFASPRPCETHIHIILRMKIPASRPHTFRLLGLKTLDKKLLASWVLSS